MTIDEYATDVVGLEDDSGPSFDPEEQAIVDHLVEFETEMFRLDCRRRVASLPYGELLSMMIELHGEHWRDAI